MNKKLLAVAVVGALALPTAAFAQPRLTISGFWKGGIEQARLSGAAGNDSQIGVVDDSSRIIFTAAQDVGGGLEGIGQFDVRAKIDDNQCATTFGPANLAAGNTYVGVRSKTMGTLLFGRHDLHYFNRESDLTAAGSLRADSISIISFAGGGTTAIAGATRTQNVVRYLTPNWGGFTVIAAFSSNPTTTDADIGSTLRKGRAFNVNPNFAGPNFQVGYSYWDSKPDATVAGDQTGHRLYGSFRFGAFKVGAAYDIAEIENTNTGAKVSDRTAWSLPVSFTFGNSAVHAHYSLADDDDAIAGDNEARMMAVSFVHNLSRQTSVALTWAQIKNEAAAAYNLFTGASLGVNPTPAAGQDPRMIGITLRQAF